MNIKIYAVDNKIFDFFRNINEEYSFKKLHNIIKSFKCFESKNISHIGHITCEKLLYNKENSKRNIKKIYYLCGNHTVDIKDNDNDGYCLLENKKINKNYINFINNFDFDKELSYYGIDNIIKEWQEMDITYKEAEIRSGKKFIENIKKAFNYAYDNKLNLIWEYKY